MAKSKALRVDHGPINEDIVDSLTEAEKEWLRSWNRHSEIPGEDEPDAGDEPAVEGDGYEDMTVAELQALLEARGLPKSGNKDDLIARLEEDDEDDEE